MQECISLYGGHICNEDDDEHEGAHQCECGASWTREEADS